MALNPVQGTAGNDLLQGGDSGDLIQGFGGDDTLRGLGGDDTLDGGSGNDILTGGSGADTLTGGTGVDIFSDTAAGLSGDHLTDFLPGDRIQLTDPSLNPANANISLTGTILSYTGGSLNIDNAGPGRLVIREVRHFETK